MNKRAVVLYLHVHQPMRIRPYSVFDTAINHDYFENSVYDTTTNNENMLRKVADKSYRPMIATLEKLLASQPNFCLSLSITGTFIDQAEKWTPDVIDGFKRLIDTGRVEILAETYYHSLAFFYSRAEFERQVDIHRSKIRELFGVETSVFRNTELAYNDELAFWADKNGFKGILAEGWDPILQGRKPNQVYRPIGTEHIALLLKNYKMSDDIAFRFGDRNWSDWPLDVGKYNQWAEASTADGSLLNLFMDFETFGEHQWSDTGIFEFFENFIHTWLSNERNTCYTVSEAIESSEPVDEISMPTTVTWADTERDLTAWLGNSMQQEALSHLYAMENDVLRSNDNQLITDWRRLQTSDQAYYMCTKWFRDGDVHAYFSAYDSPYDAFLYFINVIRDLRWRLHAHHKTGGLSG